MRRYDSTRSKNKKEDVRDEGKKRKRPTIVAPEVSSTPAPDVQVGGSSSSGIQRDWRDYEVREGDEQMSNTNKKEDKGSNKGPLHIHLYGDAMATDGERSRYLEQIMAEARAEGRV